MNGPTELKAVFSKKRNWETLRIKEESNKIGNERGNIIADATEIYRIIRNYPEKLYAIELDNWEEIDKFLETHNIERLGQKEIETLNRPISL